MCVRCVCVAGYRPVHIASQNGFLPILKHLVVCGCSINAQNDRGNTAMHMSVPFTCTAYVLYRPASNLPPTYTYTRVHTYVCTMATVVYANQSHPTHVRDTLGSLNLATRCDPTPNHSCRATTTDVRHALLSYHRAVEYNYPKIVKYACYAPATRRPYSCPCVAMRRALLCALVACARCEMALDLFAWFPRWCTLQRQAPCRRSSLMV